VGKRLLGLAPAVLVGFDAMMLAYGVALALPARWAMPMSVSPHSRLLFALAFCAPSLVSLGGLGTSRRLGDLLLALGGVLWLSAGHFVLWCCFGWAAFRWPWNGLAVAQVALAESPMIVAACLHGAVAMRRRAAR
jgi:hypothetical protein